jgi:hypothetical protein
MNCVREVTIFQSLSQGSERIKGLFGECTPKSGIISDETWTSEGSPYCIIGDILVLGLVSEYNHICDRNFYYSECFFF